MGRRNQGSRILFFFMHLFTPHQKQEREGRKFGLFYSMQQLENPQTIFTPKKEYENVVKLCILFYQCCHPRLHHPCILLFLLSFPKQKRKNLTQLLSVVPHSYICDKASLENQLLNHSSFSHQIMSEYLQYQNTSKQTFDMSSHTYSKRVVDE